jgi:ribonuclease HI
VSNRPASSNTVIEAIIASIQQLTPEQRRQLQRRLRVSGLFVPEDAVTDQHRLRVAPALGLQHPPQRAQADHAPSGAILVKPEPKQANDGTARPAPSAPIPIYHSPVSGKVVVNRPTANPSPDDPHTMAPLPGQAPEQPVVIIFDGGSKGNPGQGYGSYALRWPGAQQQIVKLRFGNQITNNEAEYDTLIAALEAVSKRLQDNGAAPATAKLDIRGDSLLVINQVVGKWQCKEERLQMRRERVRKLLQNFGTWRLTHHDRANSVEVLGH